MVHRPAEIIPAVSRRALRWRLISRRFASGRKLGAHRLQAAQHPSPMILNSPAARSAAAAIPIRDFIRAPPAGTAHWSPVMLPDGPTPVFEETATWCPPELERPITRTGSHLADLRFRLRICGVEIDPISYQGARRPLISMHDAAGYSSADCRGTDQGASSRASPTALYEEFLYDERGGLDRHLRRLSGSDRLRDSAARDHAYRSPSPFTPLGAKGLAEGNCMMRSGLYRQIDR